MDLSVSAVKCITEYRMNKHEIRTVKQEAQRFTKGINVTEIDACVLKVELPYTNQTGKNLYFYVTKRKGEKKFSIMTTVDSVGLSTLNSTLTRLQPLLKTYGLILTQDHIILEESVIPLNQRFKNMAQAVIGIDGIRRLWKVEYYSYRSINAIISEDTKSISNAANE